MPAFTRLWITATALGAAIAGCASKPPAPIDSTAEPAAAPVEGAAVPESAVQPIVEFPFVRIDRAARTVEIDGSVPIDAHDERAPNVYLELVACSPDTREHESLVVTRAKPSHIHAALLLLGLEPGTPAEWKARGDGTLDEIAATGPRLAVEFITTDGAGVKSVVPAARWIRHSQTGAAWPDSPWVFAGSTFVTRQGERRYDADFSGTILGLTTFGTEVIAWPEPISPDSGIDEPVWIANPDTVPRSGTPVTIRLRPVDG